MPGAIYVPFATMLPFVAFLAFITKLLSSAILTVPSNNIPEHSRYARPYSSITNWLVSAITPLPYEPTTGLSL